MRGFSVLELIVTAALGLLLLSVCIQFLIPSLNVTARETARSQMQERASMVLRRLTNDLGTSSAAGITLRNATPAEAACFTIQPVKSLATNLQNQYEEKLIVYTWDKTSKQVWRRVWPPEPPSLALTLKPLNPDRVPNSALNAFAAAGGTDLLANDVTELAVKSPLDPPNLGTPLTLSIECVQKPAAGRNETFRLEAVVDLRTPF